MPDLPKSRSLKVAQIGVGYWGPNLLRNLIANKDSIVSKVVDISSQRRKFVQQLFPAVLVSGDIDSIINDKEIDAVIIATPVATHYDLAMKCLNSGKHILVEKPMATKVDEIKKIGIVANEKKLVAMVGHTFLFNSAVRYVKSLIDSGELGDIRYIYSQRINLGRIRDDVDAMWNLAPHDISIIQYWLNELDPISIEKSGQSYIQDGINDVAFLNISYPNKIMAHVHVSWLDPHKVRKMTIVGSKKMVVYDDIAENKIAIYNKGIDRMAVLGQDMDFDSPGSFTYIHRSGDVVLPKIDWEEPLKIEVSHFLECIKNNIKCITDYRHAEKVVSILSAK